MSADNTLTEDMQQNLRAAQGLVNVIEAQREAEARAKAAGWNECAEAMAYIAAEAWEAGYWAREADRQAEWEEFQAWLRGRGEVRTFEEKRAAELESCRPRPGDFLGIEQDPGYVNRCRASLELIGRRQQSRSEATLAGLLRSVMQADGPDRSRRLSWAADKTFEHAAHGLFEAKAAGDALMEAATAAGIDEGTAHNLISSAYRGTTKDATP